MIRGSAASKIIGGSPSPLRSSVAHLIDQGDHFPIAFMGDPQLDQQSVQFQRQTSFEFILSARRILNKISPWKFPKQPAPGVSAIAAAAASSVTILNTGAEMSIDGEREVDVDMEPNKTGRHTGKRKTLKFMIPNSLRSNRVAARLKKK